MKNRSFPVRLGFAIAGITACWRNERSFRAHICSAILALAALIILRPAAIWWAAVGLASAMVLALEMVNSSLERLVDHLHPDVHPEIKLVKDIAAGAVLFASVGALIVAVALASTLI